MPASARVGPAIYATGGITERLRRYLRLILITGSDRIRDQVDEILEGSKCALSRIGIREVRPYKKYEVGTRKCSVTPMECGICDFVQNNEASFERIGGFLESLETSEKTIRVEEWLKAVTELKEKAGDCRKLEPCLKFGDLLIALESMEISDFYTMNGKDSQYFCRPLGQTLVVRPKNPAHDDVVCAAGDSEWNISR